MPRWWLDQRGAIAIRVAWPIASEPAASVARDMLQPSAALV